MPRGFLFERKQRNDKINRDIRLLKAFKNDLFCFFDAYIASAGNSIDEYRKGEFVELEYKAEQDYFAFFHQNTGYLSDFSNSNIGLRVNACYVMFKGLLDTFSLHTDIVNMYVNFQFDNIDSGNKTKHIETIVNQLTSYSPKLIAHHDEAIKLYNEVTQEIIIEIDALIAISNQYNNYKRPVMLVITLLLLLCCYYF